MPRTAAPWEVKRQLLVKAYEKTDPQYGFNPEQRPANEHLRFGLVNLDKPAGPSSHEVTAWVRRITGVEKIGHGGTLET